jgi:hypothetical protein
MASRDQPQVENDDEDRILSGWKPRKTDAGRFTSARDGDDLMVPFECDICVFGNLFDHEPDVIANEKDAFAMHCIRRVIWMPSGAERDRPRRQTRPRSRKV